MSAKTATPKKVKKSYVTCEWCNGSIDVTHMAGKPGRRPSKCKRPKCMAERKQKTGYR